MSAPYSFRMTQRRRIALFAVLVLVVLVMGAASSGSTSRAGRAFPVIVSILALMVSLLGTFRSEVFPFEVQVRWGTIVFPPPAPNDLGIVLPLIFLNTGFADGVIDSVALLLRGADGSVRKYVPVAELGEIGTLVGPLHISHMERTFGPFALAAKESAVKRILFFQDQANTKYPMVVLGSGEYELELFAKHTGVKRPMSYGSIPVSVTQDVLDSTGSGTWIQRTSRADELDV